MDTQMLIGSRFEAGTETAEQVLNPRTGKLIEAIPEASASQIDAAVNAA
ncbi:MAG TPA: gamma-aminobutyraldehyde dehydrogenase, partial [Devosia sp.]|nr:gamma-aminobutyraldehyde dehydrogenase [Devosia sp.]